MANLKSEEVDNDSLGREKTYFNLENSLSQMLKVPGKSLEL